jgi:hypothetical protein
MEYSFISGGPKNEKYVHISKQNIQKGNVPHIYTFKNDFIV